MDSRNAAVLNRILKETMILTDMITGINYETFIKDEKTKRAACMTLINIGEMVKLLSDDMRQNNPAIPWRSISGLRNVTAHGYQTLRMEDIWKTVTVDIPNLHGQIIEMLK